MAIREYDKGTWIETTTEPWWMYIKAKAICPDGKLRIVRLVECADTYSTVPARLSFKGKSVRGFITFRETEWTGYQEDEAERYIEFVPTGKYEHIFICAKLGLSPDTPEGIIRDAMYDGGLDSPH